MNKSMIIGFVAGAVSVTAVGGMAGYKTIKGPNFAEVISVKEVTEQVRTPYEICRDVVVTHQSPTKHIHQIAGTAIDAVLREVQDSRVSGEVWETLATVTDAAGGGHAGNPVQQTRQTSGPQTETNTRCATVYDSRTQSLGYDVTYQLNGQLNVVRMDHNPGQRIPVRNRQLNLTSDGTTSPFWLPAISKQT